MSHSVCIGRFSVIALVVAVLPWQAAPAVAFCPFCSAPQQTFAEEMEAMDAVALARMTARPKPAEGSDGSPDQIEKSTFEVVRVLRGDEWLKPGMSIETLYFGDEDKDALFFLTATDPPELMWASPLRLSERAHDYLLRVRELPKSPERLAFFLGHLEDKDEMLARDAYDEFARAPYSDVVALKEKMNHDQLVAWIHNAEVPVSRRRLYLTMLGICGTPADTPFLDEMLRSKDPERKAALDAVIGCYLALRGDEGIATIDELFLKNPDAEYSDTWSAILALRILGAETTVIPRERIVESLRLLLDRPQLADLVIPDLARFEDWTVIPKLIELFKSADATNQWVRVPVINFFRACPLPEARQAIDELAQLDPDAVKRAQIFPIFTGDGTGKPAPAPAPKDPSDSDPAGDHGEAHDEDTDTSQPIASTPPVDSAADGGSPLEPSGLETTAPDAASQSATKPAVDAWTSDVDKTDSGAAPEAVDAASPGLARPWLWGVPIALGAVLAFVMQAILRGSRSAHKGLPT